MVLFPSQKWVFPTDRLDAQLIVDLWPWSPVFSLSQALSRSTVGDGGLVVVC